MSGASYNPEAMRWILLALMLSLSPEQQDKKEGWVRLEGSYAHPFLAFKIRLPAGWAAGERQGKAACSLYGPTEEPFTPRIDLFSERDGRPVAMVAARFKEGMKSLDGEVLFVEDVPIPVAGGEGWQLVARTEKPGFPQKTLWTFVPAGERKIILSFTCSEAWFNRYRRFVDASMRSLRAYPEPTLGRAEREKFLELYRKAEALYREEKLDEARKGFEEAKTVLPTWPEIHAILGALHLRLKDYEAAEKACREAFRLDSKDSTTAYHLGLSLLRQSKSEQAEKALVEAVKLDPFEWAAQTNLGVARMALGKPDQALPPLEEGAKLAPEEAMAHFNLGQAYEALDRKSEAEREYRDTLSLDPEHEGAKEAMERMKKGR